MRSVANAGSTFAVDAVGAPCSALAHGYSAPTSRSIGLLRSTRSGSPAAVAAPGVIQQRDFGESRGRMHARTVVDVDESLSWSDRCRGDERFGDAKPAGLRESFATQ